MERNQQIDFDLSDSSLSFSSNDVNYSAFDFVLYTDKELKNVFVSSGETDDFNVSKTGRIGVDATAKLTIKNVKQISQHLYYNLVPVNLELNTEVKKQIVKDELNIINSNRVVLEENSLNGIHAVVSAAGTTFDIPVSRAPKKLEFSNIDGEFSYDAFSIYAYGPISDINLTNSGREYRTLPGISTIVSSLGDNAILEPESNTIGRISNIDIRDIGFDYSADRTLKPEAQIPQLIKIDSFSSIDTIGVTSTGSNYLDAPGLVVLDGVTKKVVSDIDLTYKLGDENVTILKNSTILSTINV